MITEKEFESIGFKFKYKERGNHNIAYTCEYSGLRFPRVDVVHNHANNWTVVAEGDDETPYSDWRTRFCGYTHNLEDLKTLFKWLDIELNTSQQ